MLRLAFRSLTVFPLKLGGQQTLRSWRRGVRQAVAPWRALQWASAWLGFLRSGPVPLLTGTWGGDSLATLTQALAEEKAPIALTDSSLPPAPRLPAALLTPGRSRVTLPETPNRSPSPVSAEAPEQPPVPDWVAAWGGSLLPSQSVSTLNRRVPQARLRQWAGPLPSGLPAGNGSPLGQVSVAPRKAPLPPTGRDYQDAHTDWQRGLLERVQQRWQALTWATATDQPRRSPTAPPSDSPLPGTPDIAPPGTDWGAGWSSPVVGLTVPSDWLRYHARLPDTPGAGRSRPGPSPASPGSRPNGTVPPLQSSETGGQPPAGLPVPRSPKQVSRPLLDRLASHEATPGGVAPLSPEGATQHTPRPSTPDSEGNRNSGPDAAALRGISQSLATFAGLSALAGGHDRPLGLGDTSLTRDGAIAPLQEMLDYPPGAPGTGAGQSLPSGVGPSARTVSFPALPGQSSPASPSVSPLSSPPADPWQWVQRQLSAQFADWPEPIAPEANRSGFGDRPTLPADGPGGTHPLLLPGQQPAVPVPVNGERAPTIAPPAIAAALPALRSPQQAYEPMPPVAAFTARHGAQQMEETTALADLGDLAGKIKRILDDEARRYGIDV